MIRCIFCNEEIAQSIKEWHYHYNYYLVKLYECNKCKKSFRNYYHNGKFSHSIPNSPDKKTRKVLNYLKKYTSASSEEIAKSLDLTLEDVIESLFKLEKKQKIERIRP